jgi:outer membrane autotransporter protein
MSNRPWLRFSFGFALVLVLCAPAMAQTQSDLVNRSIPVFNALCGSATSNGTLQQGSCDIGAGINGAAQQTQDALTASPREQTAASSTATQTTDTQVSAEAERLEKARLEEADASKRLGGFLNGSGGWGNVDARGEAEDYDVWGGGVQAGIDYRLSDALVAGFGLGWNRQNTEFDETAAATANTVASKVGGGEAESDAYSPSLYATFFSGPFHVDGIFTYTYLDYEFDRPVALIGLNNPFNATAHGDTNAHQIGTNVSLGYQFQLGGLGAGPIAGLDYRQTWIDGYRETGVPGFPLEYDDQDILSLVSSLGGEAAYAISTGIGVIAPHARITWEHEFENDARNIDARLYLNDDFTVGDTLFSRTDSPDRDYARLGAGISAQFARGISAFLDYDTVLALSDVEHHRFTAGGRIEF